MTGHADDDFQLALEYAPPQYPGVQPSSYGWWVQLRRFGGGVVLATDGITSISVHMADEKLNPGASQFAMDLIKILRVLYTARHTATQAFDILRLHPEFPTRGPVHHGRLSSARVLADAIAFNPTQQSNIFATFDDDSGEFAGVCLSAYWGICRREGGAWTQLDDAAVEAWFDTVEIIDLSAHGVGYVDEQVANGSLPSRDEALRFTGPIDAPTPLQYRSLYADHGAASSSASLDEHAGNPSMSREQTLPAGGGASAERRPDVLKAGKSALTDDEIVANLRRAPVAAWASLWSAVAELESEDVHMTWGGGQQVGTTVVNGVERPVTQMPYAIYTEATNRVIQSLYALGAIARFNWSRWDGIKKYRGPSALDAAEVADAVRMITAIVRGERFTEGAIATTLEDGTLPAALRRLRRWYDEALPHGRPREKD